VKRVYTTRIEDLHQFEIETSQENADVITHVKLSLGPDQTVVLTALEASGIADAIRDHLGDRGRF